MGWIIAIICLFLANILFLGYSSKQLSKLRQTLAVEVDQLLKEFRILTTGIVGVGRRLIEVEKQLGEWSALKSQPEENEDHTYTQAAKLIERGTSVEEVIEACGLTRTEAEILKRLYSPKDTEDSSEKIGNDFAAFYSEELAKNEPKKKSSHSKKQSPPPPDTEE